jgi:glycosyltransferase involved in cell wall biosynthesis
MRILHVGKYYYPSHGGIETVLRMTAEGLVAAGHQVTVLCFSPDRTERRETIGGVEVIRAPTYGTLLSQPVCPRFRRMLARSTAGADVVHVHSPNPLAELAAMRLPTGTRLMCTYHADVTRQRLILPAYRPVIRRFLDRCSRIVVATGKHIEYSSIVRPMAEKCAVIPFGLDPARFEPTPPVANKIAEMEKRHGEFILFVGRLVSYKGLSVLVEAMRGIPNQLVIIGDGPLAGALSDQVRDLGLQDRIHLRGIVHDENELLAYYHACKLFVLPSLTPAEAFGVVLTEAMACSKPLVTSRLNSGVVHVNQDNVNGLHADPGSAGSLRSALTRVLGDRELADRLGNTGRRRFEAEFTVDSMVQGHLELYEAERVGAL